MKMRDLLDAERTIPRLAARDKQDALRKLAAHIARSINIPTQVIVRSVLESVELPAFGPGAGVSLAHAFVPRLERSIVTFARLDPAIDFGAADGSNTDLVALLLSPAEGTSNHLQALACIARALRDSTLRNLLRAAESRESMYVILCGSDEQHRPHEPVPAECGPPLQFR